MKTSEIIKTEAYKNELDRVIEKLEANVNLFVDEEEGKGLRSCFSGLDSRYPMDSIYLVPHGWKQYDTAQDAPYFGVWYHPEFRIFVTYAEGDITIEFAKTDAGWEELKKAYADFYGAPPPAFLSLDEGAMTEHYDELARP